MSLASGLSCARTGEPTSANVATPAITHILMTQSSPIFEGRNLALQPLAAPLPPRPAPRQRVAGRARRPAPACAHARGGSRYRRDARGSGAGGPRVAQAGAPAAATTPPR